MFFWKKKKSIPESPKLNSSWPFWTHIHPDPILNIQIETWMFVRFLSIHVRQGYGFLVVVKVNKRRRKVIFIQSWINNRSSVDYRYILLLRRKWRFVEWKLWNPEEEKKRSNYREFNNKLSSLRLSLMNIHIQLSMTMSWKLESKYLFSEDS
jgi:hypothetical protein